jgi:hypothetical protein
MRLSQVRVSPQTLHAIREATRCPECRGERFVEAARGGVAGRRDHYADGTPEVPSPSRHCCCPGGPVWTYMRQVASPEDQAALDRMLTDWLRDGKRLGVVHLYHDGEAYEMPTKLFRSWVLDVWPDILAAGVAA